jgi:hypothetical protein
MTGRPTVTGVLAAVLVALLFVSVSAFPVSLQKGIAAARESSAFDAEHEAVVALQTSESARTVAAAAAEKPGQPGPQLISLTQRPRTSVEEEDYFALIDEHQDNLDQGTREGRGKGASGGSE